MPLSGITKFLSRRESGISFLETVVALAILGAVAVTFLSGLATATRASYMTDERATAESLAQSQLEWAKDTSYIYGATEYLPRPIPGSKDYVDYSATVAAQPLHNPDDGIQKITVTIKRSDEIVFKLDGYKVDR